MGAFVYDSAIHEKRREKQDGNPNIIAFLANGAQENNYPLDNESNEGFLMYAYDQKVSAGAVKRYHEKGFADTTIRSYLHTPDGKFVSSDELTKAVSGTSTEQI